MAARRRNKQKPAVAAGPVEIPDAEHELVIERVAAIDVAKAATGKVCVRLPGKSGRRLSRVWDVSARTGAIGELSEQLNEWGIAKVTLEEDLQARTASIRAKPQSAASAVRIAASTPRSDKR